MHKKTRNAEKWFLIPGLNLFVLICGRYHRSGMGRTAGRGLRLLFLESQGRTEDGARSGEQYGIESVAGVAKIIFKE